MASTGLDSRTRDPSLIKPTALLERVLLAEIDFNLPNAKEQPFLDGSKYAQAAPKVLEMVISLRRWK